MLPGVAGPRFVAGFPGTGNRVEAPDFLAGIDVPRGDEPTDAEFAARGAGDDLVFDDERRMS